MGQIARKTPNLVPCAVVAIALLFLGPAPEAWAGGLTDDVAFEKHRSQPLGRLDCLRSTTAAPVFLGNDPIHSGKPYTT